MSTGKTPFGDGVFAPRPERGGTWSFTFEPNAGSTTNSVSATNETIARPPALDRADLRRPNRFMNSLLPPQFDPEV
jgi:hypothetical protein